MYQFYPQNNGINWVQGEAGARAWIVAPNSSTLLMDSDSQKFYIKSADMSGMPKIRTFEYTETNIEPQKSAQQNTEAYSITRDEWQALRDEIEALKERLNERIVSDTQSKFDNKSVSEVQE